MDVRRVAICGNALVSGLYRSLRDEAVSRRGGNRAAAPPSRKPRRAPYRWRGARRCRSSAESTPSFEDGCGLDRHGLCGYAGKRCNTASAISVRSFPITAGCFPIGLGTPPARPRNAAWHPAANAPETSQA